MLDIYTGVDWVMCLGTKRMPHRLMEMKIINLQRAEFKDYLKIKLKQRCSTLFHFEKFHYSNSKWYSVVCMAMCMYVCLTTLGYAPNEMTGCVLGETFSQFRTKASLSFRTV